MGKGVTGPLVNRAKDQLQCMKSLAACIPSIGTLLGLLADTSQSANQHWNMKL